MKKPLHIIKTWFETGDVPTQQQFHDAFDSFHHKDSGEVIVDRSVNESGDVSFKFTDGEILTIEKFVPDVSKPMEYIDGLVNAISTITTNITTLQTGKVDKVDGKGLSDTNFSQAEKDKLAGLENYIPPSSHPIDFIEGLQTALDTLTQGLALKVDKEDGKGLSSNDFTTEEKQKLADLNPVGFGKAVDSEGNSIVAIGQGDLLTFEGATIDETNKKIIINSPTKVSELQNDVPFALQGDPIKTGSVFKTTPLQAGITISPSIPTAFIKITPPYNKRFYSFVMEIQLHGGPSGVGTHPITMYIGYYAYSANATGINMTSFSTRIITDKLENDLPVRYFNGDGAAIYIGDNSTNFGFSFASITKVFGYYAGTVTDSILKEIQEQTVLSTELTMPTGGYNRTNNLIQGKQSNIAITDENETTKFFTTDKISFGGNVEFDSGNKRINIIGGGDVNFTDGDSSRVYKKQSLNYANTTGALCITVPYGIRSYHIKTLAYNYGSATDLTEYKVQGYTVNAASWFYPTVQKTGTDQRTVRLYAGSSQYRIYIGELTDKHPVRAGLFVEEVLSLIGGDPTINLSIETAFTGTLKGTF